MIQRTFHPIGQGAFYSEKHKDFNIVFDCGNWKDANSVNKVIKNSFNTGEDIDILFVSHFDYDHVNKIDILKSNFHIKRVVLPLLHENEKNFLIRFYDKLGFNNITQLIRDPIEFFGDETIILRVKISENNYETNDEATIEIDDLNESMEINGGTILKIGYWAFIPYNIEYNLRKKKLEKGFEKLGLDINEFKDDLNYSIDNRKAIQKVYDSLKGGINKNSMMLYSGPAESNQKKYILHTMFSNIFNNLERCCYPRYRYKYIYNKVGCVYTGDANLNESKLNIIFKKYWDRIGTVQIPHHGEMDSFDLNLLSDNQFICPISVGRNNTYGHPSGILLSDIYLNNSIPILVTENYKSMFIQIII